MLAASVAIVAISRPVLRDNQMGRTCPDALQFVGYRPAAKERVPIIFGEPQSNENRAARRISADLASDFIVAQDLVDCADILLGE